ncbi:MAG: PASTA domain-containing protein, partial [Tidjanibacter sp.]|nr:PASTA domain-containing protein [Tidjanibacter sp.]
FKAVSLMALLEIGGLNLNRIIVCGPSKTKNIEGSNVRDTHIVGEGSGTTTLKGAFIESSNIGFAQTVTEVFKDSDKKNYPNYRRWMEYINSIGFGEVKHIQAIRGYGLDTIKDPSSLHKRRAPWSKKTLTNNAYGYELTMTPLQTLMFYNAVANDGVLVAPMLIKQLVTDGEPGAPTPVKVVNPAICSQQTLRKVQECMEGVVSHPLGTAHELSSLPFKVAGKTGTAQVVQEVGKRGKDKDGKVNAYITLDGSREYLATFVGYFPADDPKYTCIVSLNTFQKAGETSKKIYGSNLALPVFKEITEYIYAHDAQWFTTARRINNPTPKAMAAEAPKTKKGTMPNVKGMGLRDALYTLEQLGLRVKVSGKGSVAEQSIAAGEAIGEGAEVRITLK